MKQIKLTQGYKTIVDNLDYEYLNQVKWYFYNGYAIRNSSYINGKRHTIYMHRVINNTPEGFETDHINRNKLDNRRSNLRTTTGNQNRHNRDKYINNTSGYKGVTWNKFHQKWQAQLKINKQHIHLGYYDKLNIAWLARRWGERAYLGKVFSE